MIEEDLAHQQTRTERAANEEEQLRRQQDAGEVGTERSGLRIERAEEEVRVERGKEFGKHNPGAEQERHREQHDGERAVATLIVAGLAIAVEDVDERDRCYSANQKIVDHVGQVERRVIRIGNAACAEHMRDVLLAHQTKQAREYGRDH